MSDISTKSIKVAFEATGVTALKWELRNEGDKVLQSGNLASASSPVVITFATETRPGKQRIALMAANCEGSSTKDFIVSPDTKPSPTPTACVRGPTIESISNVTSKGLTALFDGENIQGIDYQVLNSVGVVKASGHIVPVNNHPNISFAELADGQYKLAFKATNCVGSSTKDFKIETAVVCDPFGGDDEECPSGTCGLEAKLTYLPSDAHAIQTGLSTQSFHPDAAQVILSPTRLVLSQLNVPTRLFSEGFTDEASGVTLKNLDGEKLIEYFSVQAQSNLRLDTADAEGDYELAILSDDGSILDIDPTGEGKSFIRSINNDGVHPNALGCSIMPVSMVKGREIPIKMNYYQGPRERIALMMLWRKKTSSSAAEPECGKAQGDDYYFKKTAASGSTPTSKYNELLSRGWKVLKKKNFVLPGDRVNPCLNK